MSRTSISSPRSLLATLVLMVGWIFLLQACGGGGGGAPSGPVQKAFRTATLIETDNAGGASTPQIAIDANGNALAVWQQDGDATAVVRYDIWSNRYTAATGLWGTAARIETDDTGDASSPQIAIDANGNALAVWQQSDGTRRSIRYNRYTASSNSWGTADVIETDLGDAFSPQIAIDANGNALAVWQQDGDATAVVRYDIWSNRYTAATGLWGTAARIETDDTGDASSPEIAIDANGNALAVWQQDGDATAVVRYDIWSNRYTAATGLWGTAARIETDDTGDASSPQIAIDANGNALAVWQQSDGTRSNIWSNRYTASSNSWGTAALIETDNGDLPQKGIAQIAIDANGNALAVWSQDGDATAGVRSDIWYNRYTASSNSWGTAALIETDNTGGAGGSQIAIDANGNALAVWQQSDGTRFNIWSNRYTASSNSWGTAALIETDNLGDAFSPQIAFDVNGNALAVWHQFDGTLDNIWANRYQ